MAHRFGASRRHVTAYEYYDFSCREIPWLNFTNMFYGLHSQHLTRRLNFSLRYKCKFTKCINSAARLDLINRL